MREAHSGLNRAASDLVPLGGDLVLTGLSRADADRLRTAGLQGAIRLAPDHHVGTAAANETSSPDGASTARHSTAHQRDVIEPKEERP